MALAQTKPKKLTRGEKSEETRKALVEAAVKVIGKYGYEGASVARIVWRAKVGNGTFYNYFKSRQHLFDLLLPEMGERLLEYFRIHMNPNVRGWQREEERLRVYFEFLVENPWFHRLVNEAETLAPKAYRSYFASITSAYARALRRSIKNGEITSVVDEDLEPLTYMLISIRAYLAQHYAYSNGVVRVPDKQIFKTYIKLVRYGLFDNSKTQQR